MREEVKRSNPELLQLTREESYGIWEGTKDSADLIQDLLDELQSYQRLAETHINNPSYRSSSYNGELCRYHAHEEAVDCRPSRYNLESSTDLIDDVEEEA